MPSIFTLPAGQPHAEAAARWMLARYSPTTLPRVLLLLPTRRACGIMRDAFLRIAEGKTLLLPRMVPLAELTEQFPLLQEGLPKPMPASQRLALMAQQVHAFEHALRPRTPPSSTRSAALRPSLCHSLTLAESLIALQDEAIRAGAPLTPEALESLTPSMPLYAQHWMRNIAFLRILTEIWPQIEADEGAITETEREIRITERITNHWQHHPCADPVIVLGSTASHPSNAALLAVIADMPQGAVILPGYNPDYAAEVEEGSFHPLESMVRFLKRWESPYVAPIAPPSPPRNALWMEALCSTQTVATWPHTPAIPPTALEGLHLIACDHLEEEARVAALLLRESLEKPNMQAALITPDERFMAQVAAHLRRYGITANRLSAGKLAHTQQGSLWLSALEALLDPESMDAQLALARHPLVRPEHGEWVSWLAAVEPALRGWIRQKKGGLPKLPEALALAPAAATLSAWLDGVAKIGHQHTPVTGWISQIVALLDPLVPEAGEGADSVAETFESLAYWDTMGPLSLRDFTDLLQHTFDQPWRGGLHDPHPHIHLLTPVEARLQPFDRVILARMQEGIWPRIPAPNPWLNRAQQSQLGLEDSQRNRSRMAHDLLLFGSTPELFLTYAHRDTEGPVMRSRFVERLLARLAAQGIGEESISASHYRLWAAEQDTPKCYAPSPPPMPCPPATQRPTRIAISRLDTLFLDPYALYAEYVLGLKPLEPTDAMPSPKDFGIFTHRAMEGLVTHWNRHNRPATPEECDAIATEALRHLPDDPTLQIFWRNRLRRALDFANHLEALHRPNIQDVESELPIETTLMLGPSPLTLTGRIDRVEQSNNGTYRIVDYKTGSPPTIKDVREGRAVQLLAYAMLFQADHKTVESLEYWGLPHGTREGEHIKITEDALQQSWSMLTEKLRHALEAMQNPSTPFLARPTDDSASPPSVYDGLSRYDEWAG